MLVRQFIKKICIETTGTKEVQELELLYNIQDSIINNSKQPPAGLLKLLSINSALVVDLLDQGVVSMSKLSEAIREWERRVLLEWVHSLREDIREYIFYATDNEPEFETTGHYENWRYQKDLNKQLDPDAQEIERIGEHKTVKLEESKQEQLLNKISGLYNDLEKLIKDDFSEEELKSETIAKLRKQVKTYKDRLDWLRKKMIDDYKPKKRPVDGWNQQDTTQRVFHRLLFDPNLTGALIIQRYGDQMLIDLFGMENYLKILDKK